MQPRPTGRLGLLRVPGPSLNSLEIRFADLAQRDQFHPAQWPRHSFTASAAFPGWWEFDLDALGLADAAYEYEFLVNDTQTAADPYADSLTRFGGYRGVFTILHGARVAVPFRWDDEFPPGVTLPANNRIVIYEMPIKWMASDPDEDANLVELGTFDRVIFAHLDDLAALHVNCIELLPVQDSPQTLNWGYGTRFFLAPDYDVGSAIDAKCFVKACHQRGIRVVLDVVMNMFAPKCPLAALARDWFAEPASAGRQDWGQILFRFQPAVDGGFFAAREFLFEMAEFWVSEYHVDGYRIDDFADINNWDFVQQFRDRATAKSQALFPGKPFVVICEDSNRRFVTTADDANNPNGRKVTDAIWNFGFRDEVRRLLTNTIFTTFGEPARSVRVQHLILNQGIWNDWNHQFDRGFGDLTCSVPYITSHDVADGPRLMNVLLGPMVQAAGFGDGGRENVKGVVDSVDSPSANADLRKLVVAAARRVCGGFAILMTAVGMPMFLAGEEFGDVHDTDWIDVNRKQQDPVQWQRAAFAANANLRESVGELIQLRTSHPALHGEEVEFFYFHPRFDDNAGPRVFAYCRTAAKALGSAGQVAVVANIGPDAFPVYVIPGWPWTGPLTEVAAVAESPGFAAGMLTLSLDPFEVRVFQT